MDMILDYLNNLYPWLHWTFITIGSLTVIGTGIDKIIPDSIDGGFMTKIFNIPILGGVLRMLSRFSPFNVREGK